jgi:ATP-dependent Clp protease ATP-binding subunit ClpA
VRKLREEIETTKVEIEKAERAYELEKVAELRYGKLRELDSRLKEAEKSLTEKKSMLLKEEVDDEDIAHIVSRWTGIPVQKLLEGEIGKLLHLGEELHKRVVGQDEAVEAVADAVVRARAGIQDPDRPIGSFIFLGPTGVGKTELARTLAQYLFNDEKALVRIDMSEYMEKHAVARLIGAPPGYVGYEEGGQLTEAVRRKPFSVVLFDEIEKAHPDVFNVLLQILDEGRLTDSQGRTVDFRNTVVIMTSNVGSGEILALEGKADDESYERMKAKVLGLLKQSFRPEFLNRVDETVVFHALDRDQLVRIVDIQLERLRSRLRERHRARGESKRRGTLRTPATTIYAPGPSRDDPAVARARSPAGFPRARSRRGRSCNRSREGSSRSRAPRRRLPSVPEKNRPKKNYPREAVRGAPPGAGVEIGERRQCVLRGLTLARPVPLVTEYPAVLIQQLTRASRQRHRGFD